jgi:hypothetical protein
VPHRHSPGARTRPNLERPRRPARSCSCELRLSVFAGPFDVVDYQGLQRRPS